MMCLPDSIEIYTHGQQLVEEEFLGPVLPAPTLPVLCCDMNILLGRDTTRS